SRATSIGTALTAGYRADGLRAWKQTASGRTYYLYDRGEPVVEFSASGTVTKVNVHAPDGLVASGTPGNWMYYAFDQQGNVSQRLNSSGAVLSRSAYDAYGVESGSTGLTDSFGYNARWGYVLDRETGLYLCQRRYYDPAQGRWLNRDPIGAAGGVNVYQYCSSRPTLSRDHTGYQVEEADEPSEEEGGEPSEPARDEYGDPLTGNSTWDGFLGISRALGRAIRSVWPRAGGNPYDPDPSAGGVPVPDPPGKPGRGRIDFEFGLDGSARCEQHPYHPYDWDFTEEENDAHRFWHIHIKPDTEDPEFIGPKRLPFVIILK
ncbi:MAG: RHS repeat-associated core domain-containing protein, partial [Alphaproteobacteria bacterium]